MRTEKTIKEKMDDAAFCIVEALKSGMPVSKEDLKFLASYNAQFVKSAGNAGKRKVVRTGK